MKRHLIYLVSFMTVFGLWSCSSDDLGLEVNEKQEVKSLVSVSATDAYNVLLESFISKSRSVEDISYPDFYGGAYIDKGELVILSPIRFLGKDNYEAILGRGNYRLEGCDYSYKELEDVMSIIDKYKLENKESSVSNNFYSYEISEKDNRVYNPQNEMFRLLGTKRSFSQNETFFFSHPYPLYPALFRLISHF